MPLAFARSVLAGGVAEPVYALSGFPSNTNEGSIVTFTLTTENVAENTNVPYSITGISNSDISSGSLSGNFTIGNDGTATRTITIRNDSLSEGTETLTISTAGLSENISILDTSRTVSYSWWSVGDTTPNEGTTINVEARAYNTSETMYWYFTGTNDVSAYQGQLTKTGPFTSGSDTYYKHTTSITFNADATTEGNESYNLYLRSNSTSGTIRATRGYTIQDTSLTPEDFTNASVVNIGNAGNVRASGPEWYNNVLMIAPGTVSGSYTPTRYFMTGKYVSGSSISNYGAVFTELYNPTGLGIARTSNSWYYLASRGESRYSSGPQYSSSSYSPAYGSNPLSYTPPDGGTFGWGSLLAINEIGTQFSVKNVGYQGKLQVYKYTHGGSASWHVDFDYTTETGRNEPSYSNSSLRIAVDKSTISDKVYITQNPQYNGNGWGLYTEIWDSTGYIDRWYHGISVGIKDTHIVGNKFVYVDNNNDVHTVNRT